MGSLWSITKIISCLVWQGDTALLVHKDVCSGEDLIRTSPSFMLNRTIYIVTRALLTHSVYRGCIRSKSDAILLFLLNLDSLLDGGTDATCDRLLLIFRWGCNATILVEMIFGLLLRLVVFVGLSSC